MHEKPIKILLVEKDLEDIHLLEEALAEIVCSTWPCPTALARMPFADCTPGCRKHQSSCWRPAKKKLWPSA